MVTTIEIPDPVFDAVERLARRLGVSRDELIAQAVAAFVQAHDERVTAQLNQVYAVEDSALDEVLSQLQALSMRHSISDSW
ncbi:MAG TPA: ribbon-helix-helix protein, CopG family [Anaerolineae bacterium]|nr:ribbon-helix-helix protein, CopG family [Anaerolineae bacterium]